MDEKAIRQEYKWVPAPIYRKKRIEVLQRFLDRARIYETQYFRDRYEEAARENLRRAIQYLRG